MRASHAGTLPGPLIELLKQGIKLEPDGERLRFSPREATTPAVIDGLRAHKATLLDALRRQAPNTSMQDLVGALAWQAALDAIDDDPTFSHVVKEAVRAATVRLVGNEQQGATEGK
jgi:hypothetical protein